MSSTTFSSTMVEAIRKYRAMLRKYLSQSERVNQLHLLNLKNPQLYTNDFLLYEAGHKIIEHLQSIDSSKNGYYSYSGISRFANHLEKFLSNYKIEAGTHKIIHTCQLASRYLVRASQLLSPDQTNPASLEELEQCNEMIALYASPDQIELYQKTLATLSQKNLGNHSTLYRNTLRHFSTCLEKKESVAA